MLLRFFDGRAPAEIAHAQGVPPGTVRWRINEGLRRLRQRLDQAYGGQRDTWRAVLLPLVDVPHASPPLPPPTMSPAAAPKVVLLGLAGLLAGGAAGWLWLNRGVMPASSTQGLAVAPDAPRPTIARSFPQPDRPPADPKPKEETTMKNTATKMAALLSVALPALMASAESAKPLTREQAIDFCVEFRENAVPCKDDVADLLVARVSADKRAAFRKKALQEIVDDGTGALETRKAKCAAELEKKSWLAKATQADRGAIRACQAQKECKAAIACGMKVVLEVGKSASP